MNKLYLVTSNSTWGSCPKKIFPTRMEAEYFVWECNQANKDKFIMSYLSVNELELSLQPLAGKDYDKFKKQRIEAIDKEIKEKKEHSAKDLDGVWKLEEEKNNYK